MLIRDPVLQELNRRVFADHGMVAAAIVENLDVVEQVLEDEISGEAHNDLGLKSGNSTSGSIHVEPDNQTSAPRRIAFSRSLAQRRFPLNRHAVAKACDNVH